MKLPFVKVEKLFGLNCGVVLYDLGKVVFKWIHMVEKRKNHSIALML